METLKSKKTRTEIQQFVVFSQNFLKNPAVQNLPIGGSMQKLSMALDETFKPLNELETKLKKDIQHTWAEGADVVKITDWDNKPDMMAREYLYNKGEANNFFATQEKVDALKSEYETKKSELMAEEIEFEPLYADTIPNTQILPLEAYKFIRGFVMKPEAHTKVPASKGNVRQMGK